ncbi:hypothetical protein P12x_001372 [Tundrisphaera lichenicola]|uniref:hypothetical protein n=1 Tax=Tundrisphaera lichenicola TaxID=2029860 RepID=UPI003EB88137
MREPLASSWPPASTIGWATIAYLICVAAATFPVVLSIGSAIPGELTDPLEHLWIMKWCRACLLEGRSPFFTTGLHYPMGVPLGYFPTMHLQTAFYMALGLITSNDVACFQVIWTYGFVSTGLAGCLLAWWVTRQAGPSWVAGLGLMLCGPMMMHAHGHLETMQLGAVPIFLISWIRFLDRPDSGRLIASAGLYLFMVAGAPYFAVLAIFPSAWYVTWAVWSSERSARRAWLASRIPWLVGFSMLVLPGLLLLFSSQIWATFHGYSMKRPRSEFNALGAPIWSSFLPSPRHRLGQLTCPDLFGVTGYASRMSECSSYLGIVPLALLGYAAIRRVKFARAGFWWSALILMTVLSWGSEVRLGTGRFGLPAGWLYGIFPPFQWIRVPARFNLFAAVCAVAPVSAALGDIFDRLKRTPFRPVVLPICIAIMMLDLSMTPFPSADIPPMPAIYLEMAGKDPESSLVDVPMFGSSEGQVFSSLWGYWQSIHKLKTTAGYPGLTDVGFDSEIVSTSPFWSKRLEDPTYLSDATEERFGPVLGVDARDYAWLYLKAHRLKNVVIHRGIDPKFVGGIERMELILAGARSFEDDTVSVYDFDRLEPPGRLTWLCASGWRPGRGASAGSFGVLRRARLFLFNPTADRPIRVELGRVSAFHRARSVRLLEDGHELARWTIQPGTRSDLDSGPILLGTGFHDLILESDGDDRPTRHDDRLDDAKTPYSLRLDSVRVRPADREGTVRETGDTHR